jgi:hypothetical protein
MVYSNPNDDVLNQYEAIITIKKQQEAISDQAYRQI